jgi:hypothetical protein
MNARVILLLTSLMFCGIAVAADIGISPPRVELTGMPGETLITTVAVLTSAGGTQQVATTFSDWSMGPTGDVTYFAPSTATYGATGWFVVDADDFVLGARGSREVRLAVTIPLDQAVEGTYHGTVFFTIVPPPNETRGIGVITTARVGFTVYVTIAGTERVGSELVDV